MLLNHSMSVFSNNPSLALFMLANIPSIKLFPYPKDFPATEVTTFSVVANIAVNASPINSNAAYVIRLDSSNLFSSHCCSVTLLTAALKSANPNVWFLENMFNSISVTGNCPVSSNLGATNPCATVLLLQTVLASMAIVPIITTIPNIIIYNILFLKNAIVVFNINSLLYPVVLWKISMSGLSKAYLKFGKNCSGNVKSST